jgi:hypothetical protein
MNNLIEWTKKIYQLPSPQIVAMRELEDAQRRLLASQSALEYAQAMCQYRQAQIKRLTAVLRKTED